MRQLLIVAISVLFLYSCNVSASKTSDSDPRDKRDELRELGFDKVKSVMNKFYDKERLMWESKYKIQFLSDDEVATITARKDSLITGKASQYLGEVPMEAANKILSVYRTAKNEHIYYWNDLVGQWRRVGRDWYNDKADTDKGILVIAPPEMFTPNADITKKKDPMAIVKVDYGYIVLAAW